jgi:hypothetical protein
MGGLGSAVHPPICAVMCGYSPVTRWALASWVPFSSATLIAEIRLRMHWTGLIRFGAALRSVRLGSGVRCGEELDPVAGGEVDGVDAVGDGCSGPGTAGVADDHDPVVDRVEDHCG